MVAGATRHNSMRRLRMMVAPISVKPPSFMRGVVQADCASELSRSNLTLPLMVWASESGCSWISFCM